MDELINIGVRQGTVLGFSEHLTIQSAEFKVLEDNIKKGRYGIFEPKGVSKSHLYVVLTQDCTISSGKYIELAQLKKKTVKDESKVQHLLLGKDYSKLYVNFEGDIYETEEALLTKVSKELLIEALSSEDLKVKSSLSITSMKIVLDWRLLAYRREPFPDKFNRILIDYFKKSNFWFTDFLSENQEHVHSVRIFVTPESDEDADLYHFSITLVLTESGQAHDETLFDGLERMINEFSQMNGVVGLQTEEFEQSSFAFPEHLTISLTVNLDEFSFANAYVMREFNFQYLCY
ncbi:hypothetical protein L2744_18600 [Shewanella profunda]|uniref:hypothetical protein n=1 Tax=Shewanella profunda TaxID=254793 RepID=UPI00200C1583|nr:hypothetical protein [Shewanella profunda]MCL1091573.1 hypothetical protein [Shewanella profunda]